MNLMDSLVRDERESRMTNGEKKRGRTPTFGPETRAMLADLIRQHGVRGAREIAPISVSSVTLLKIAGEHGIKLKKGRRPKRAA